MIGRLNILLEEEGNLVSLPPKEVMTLLNLESQYQIKIQFGKNILLDETEFGKVSPEEILTYVSGLKERIYQSESVLRKNPNKKILSNYTLTIRKAS